MKTYRNSYSPSKMRILLCTIGLLFLFVSLIGRLYYIQIIQYKKFCKIKQNQYVLIKNIQPKRGIIYDRNGVELAISVDVNSIYAVPSEIDNDLEVAKKISSILGIEEAVLIDKLKTRSSFVWIQRKISDEIAEKIENSDIEGIGFIKEGKRFYPNGKLANQIIGITGLDEEGLSGIEFYFNRYIKGEKEVFVSGRDAYGRNILKDNSIYLTPPEGNDIYLTIDKFIQYVAERELEKTCIKYNAKAGTVIVQNPSTGEILALANWPTFDSTNINSDNLPLLKSRAVTDIYEPGSTFKVITAAAALEERIVQTDDKFFCENGRYVFAGYPIRDHEKEGWLTFQEVIEKSSNIGIAKVSEQLGKEKLFQYASNFGFGELTGVQLPGEVKGILRPPIEWSKISLSRISFGQEIGITAIQLISAISAVANRGVLMKPYIISTIKDKKGDIIKEFKPEIKSRVIKEEAAKVLTDILEGVVKRGTGQLASIEGFKVAGKTGTAQKIDPELKAYSPDKYISSFVGYLPADDPKVTILVIVDEPHKIHWGSAVCAPPFASIGREIMRYLNIPPQDDLMIAKTDGVKN